MAAPYKDTVTGAVVHLEPKDAVGNESRYVALHQTRPDQDAIMRDVAAAQRGLSPYQAAVLRAVPLSYWPLDDAPGSRVVRALVGPDGFPIGTPTFGAAGIDGSLATEFNVGVDYTTGGWGWISIPPVPNLPAFSIECWGYVVPFDLEEYWTPTAVLMRGLDGGDADGEGCAFLRVEKNYLDDDGAMEYLHVGTNGVAEGTTFALHTWHHWVGTFDGAAVAVYRNGVNQTAYPGGTTPEADDPYDSYISAIGYVAGEGDLTFYAWRGRLQDVAIYDRVLTEAEILEHCSMRRPLEVGSVQQRSASARRTRPERPERSTTKKART